MHIYVFFYKNIEGIGNYRFIIAKDYNEARRDFLSDIEILGEVIDEEGFYSSSVPSIRLLKEAKKNPITLKRGEKCELLEVE